MSCIVIETQSCDRQDKSKACAQHVVDLDTAIFTCNWCYGYQWFKGEGVQDHFIRGIVMQNSDKPVFGNGKTLHFSSHEVLVKDLPLEDQKKVYGLYDDKELDDIWRMIRDTRERYTPEWLLPQDYYPVKRNYILSRRLPLMIIEKVVLGKYSIGYAPLIVQPNAIIGGMLCNDKLDICTTYGKCKFTPNSENCNFDRYRDLCWKASKLEQVRAMPLKFPS